MASLTDAPVRLLLDSGSGVSACSPEFASHVKTLSACALSNRSSDQGVNMEVRKISKPIVSAGKMVRSGRRIVLDEHNSFIEDKKTEKRIPVELTRGDVFEITERCDSTSKIDLGQSSVLLISACRGL